jgi:hypothetical protein
VLAIVTALSETKDCHALERAARSINRVATRHSRYGDVVETGEVFRVYVRRLLGQAAEVCSTMADFRSVRRPLRDTLIKIPEVGGVQGPLSQEAANTRIAEVLRDKCLEDVAVSGATDCPEIFAHYAALCDQPEVPPKELAAAKPASGKGAADAGHAQPAKVDAARDAEAAKARLALSRQNEAPGCALMKEVSARFPPPAAGPTGSSK